MSCTGQCSGCALRPGAAANIEADNRMAAALSALAANPFLCHHKLGWTPDTVGYPIDENAFKAAHANLLAAPKLIHDAAWAKECISDATDAGLPASMFAADRLVLGRTPNCAGWKAAVSDLARQGWFSSLRFKAVRRAIARKAMRDLDRVKTEHGAAIADLRVSVSWLVEELREAKIKFSGFGGVK